MKSKPIRKMFKVHRMPQLFVRPRPTSDNPLVELLFGSIKTAPQYLKRFLDPDNGIEYFDFLWYNTEHYHSGIDHVTLEQCHQGLQENIAHRRNQNFKKQR